MDLVFEQQATQLNFCCRLVPRQPGEPMPYGVHSSRGDRSFLLFTQAAPLLVDERTHDIRFAKMSFTHIAIPDHGGGHTRLEHMFVLVRDFGSSKLAVASIPRTVNHAERIIHGQLRGKDGCAVVLILGLELIARSQSD
jgi:hypothetical protein